MLTTEAEQVVCRPRRNPGAHEDLDGLDQFGRDLRERVLDDLDVISSGVEWRYSGAGIAANASSVSSQYAISG